MSERFHATTAPLPCGGRVVEVHGAVDLYTAPELRTRMLDALLSGSGGLVVDLTDTTFLDSSALAALVAAHRRAGLLQGRLVVVNVDAGIAGTLRMTGMDRLIDVVADGGEARARLAGRGDEP